MIGKGVAEVHAPGTVPCDDPAPGPDPRVLVAEPVVTVFHGPTQDKLQLHTYSPDLGAASPVVDSFIVDSTEDGSEGAGRPGRSCHRSPEDHRLQRHDPQGHEGRQGEVQAEEDRVPP